MATVLLATGPPLTPSSRAAGNRPRGLHVPGTGRACRESRGGCQGPGASALRGSQRRLPCAHQRGNLRASPRAAPSQLETLKAALAPGVGWAGLGPPTHIPSKPRWAAARLPCPTQNLLRAPLTSSWGTEGEGRSSPAEGQGELLGKASPLHRIPKGHPNTVPKNTRGEQSSQRALSQARRGQRAAAPVPARPCSALPLCQVHRGGFCVEGILFQTRFPLLTPPFRPQASPASALLLPHGLERFNHPCVGKGGED